MISPNSPILGIDVDKEFLVVFLMLAESTRTETFRNNKTGIRSLITWLKKLSSDVVLVCLESTGRYGELVSTLLFEQGHKVCVLNPVWIARHKEALNRINKTDPGDAEAIADYARCFSHRLRPWKPLDPDRLRLRDVVGQIQLLKKHLTAFSNRGGCGLEFDEVKRSNAETIEFLKNKIKELQALRKQLYDSLPALRKIREFLDSSPCIGPEIADALIVKVDFQDFLNGRQLACYLGCASSEWKSGKQERKGKQKKTGDPGLRSLIRQGAASGLRSHYFRPFVNRLRQKGLSDGQIVGAIARKMLLIAHAVVRKETYFDPLYTNPISFKN